VKSPVALFMFRRPDTTAVVLDAIRAARPSILLVVADGPRAGRDDDAAACAATRALIDGVDWPCDVRREFANENMGCRRRVSSGLAWVFGQVPEAIILEDDCVPDATFFPFCDELLDRYRNDARVAQISGANNQKGRRRGADSYYFSRYNPVWGWASWRRAFAPYDATMRRWPELRDARWLEQVLDSRAQVQYWTTVFQDCFDGRIDTWDYQWVFASWLHDMLAVVPNRNLVRNIGFGAGATHTAGQAMFADDPLEKMEFPLRHPAGVARNVEADRFSERLEYTEPWRARARKALRRVVPDPIMRAIRAIRRRAP
jgi:hypothetical protein